MRDPFDLPEFRAWLRRAEEDMFPKMEKSAMSLMIGSSKPDAKLAVEVGAAVLFDKPLIVIAERGMAISKTLRKIAFRIVEVDSMTSPEARAKITEAINAVAVELARRKMH